MKHLFSLFIIVFSLFSCEDDTQFNNPSFEAIKNGETWKATGSQAFTDADGRFNIRGTLNGETILLKLSNTTSGLYNLKSTNEGQFITADGTIYSTANNPDPSVTIYPKAGTALGVAYIDDYNGASRHTTGRFRFTAYTKDGLKGITISGDANSDDNSERFGIFYQTGISGKIAESTNTIGCANAIVSVANAAATYNATLDTDLSFPTVCATYKTAIQNKIATCGDASGDLAALLTSLGNCTTSAAPKGVSVTLNGTLYSFNQNVTSNLNTATSLRAIRAEKAGTSEWISFKIPETSTGSGLVSDLKFNINNTDYTVSIATSNIQSNTAQNSKGTFSGSSVETPTITVANGIFNIAN